jgi:hypothetical protein
MELHFMVALCKFRHGTVNLQVCTARDIIVRVLGQTGQWDWYLKQTCHKCSGNHILVALTFPTLHVAYRVSSSITFGSENKQQNFS